MTTPTENKAIVRRFITDFVNGGDRDLADELLTTDYTRHDPDTPGGDQGIEPFLKALGELDEAFPDSEIAIGEMIAEDDRVAFEGTMTGTHEGEFMGVPGSGTAVQIPGNAMHRIRDGKIAETWATWHFLGIMQQIGALE